MKEESGRKRFGRIASIVLASSRNCHAVGASTCALFLGLTAWVWSSPEVFVSSTEYDRSDLIDAMELLDHANDWRTKFVSLQDESESLGRRASQIASWLPASVDWPQVDESYRRYAEDSGIELVSLNKQETHVGSRVGVVTAECQVKGSYVSVCQFVRRLSALKSNKSESNTNEEDFKHLPAWCHRIQIDRLPGRVGSDANCAATITIRIPFAADNTAAANLMKQEGTDA